MNILFVVIGMVPISFSVLIGVAASHDEREKSNRGFVAAIMLFFAGLTLIMGLCSIDSGEWYWWLSLSAVLFIATIIAYKLWKKNK